MTVKRSDKLLRQVESAIKRLDDTSLDTTGRLEGTFSLGVLNGFKKILIENRRIEAESQTLGVIDAYLRGLK